MYSIIDCGYVKHKMPAQKHAHQVYRSICKILHDHPPDLMAILKGSLDLHSIDSLFGTDIGIDMKSVCLLAAEQANIRGVSISSQTVKNRCACFGYNGYSIKTTFKKIVSGWTDTTIESVYIEQAAVTAMIALERLSTKNGR